MAKRRINVRQMSLRDVNAHERQQAADELEEKLAEKGRLLQVLQRAIEAEEYTGNRPGPWDQWKKHRANLVELRTRKSKLLGEIAGFKKKRVELGGHANFRLPAVAGFGLAGALRTVRRKEAM